MEERWLVIIVGFLGLALLVVGCEEGERTDLADVDAARDDWFIVQSPARVDADEENILVTWKGQATGHEVGGTSAFTISLENVSEDETPVRYCLSLLDQEGVVAELAQKRHVVSSLTEFEEEVSVQFPDDLVAGTYGLVLVVEDPAGCDAGVVYIGVGSGMGDVIEIPRSVVDQAVEACPSVESEQSRAGFRG